MAATTNLLTWEAFEQLPDDCMHYEVLEGELVALPPAEPIHNSIATRILLALVVIDAKCGFRARMELGFRLTIKPPTFIQPDVSVVKAERLATAEREGSFFGAPELAVEVVSPSESASDIERKVELLLKHGSEAVWVVYPRGRRVRVHCADGTSRIFGAGESLTLPSILPGWELPVAQIFE
jgi:Uma2 family endonuclease